MLKDKVPGVRVPDSALAGQITQFVRDRASALLFDHSTRVYLWGAIEGDRRELRFDPELLYAAAMFHDIGLTSGFADSRERFEVDGANAARDFLRSHAIPEADVQKVWLAIALHTTPGVPVHMDPEIALTQAGAGMDVAGRGYENYSAADRRAVLAAYGRPAHFKEGMIDAFYEGMRFRPDSTFGTFNDDILAFKDPAFKRADLCRIILESPWEN